MTRQVWSRFARVVLNKIGGIPSAVCRDFIENNTCKDAQRWPSDVTLIYARTLKAGFLLYLLMSAGSILGVARIERNQIRDSPFRLVIGGNFDGLRGKVGYSSDSSTGFGYAGSLKAQIAASAVRLSFGTSYQTLRLKRDLNGSGVIEDPSPPEFIQTIRYLGVEGFGSYALTESFTFDEEMTAWWIDGGAQVLLPLSAKQKDSVSGEASFKATDRPVFLLVGSSAVRSISQRLDLIGSLHMFYNVAARGESRLYGLRLGVFVAIR